MKASVYAILGKFISRIIFALSLAQIAVFIYSVKTGALPENALIMAALNAVAITEISDGFYLFGSAFIMLFMGVLGINIKKGTGAPGGCFVMGLIFVLIKLSTVIECILLGETSGIKLYGSLIMAVVGGAFAYCSVKQWS